MVKLINDIFQFVSLLVTSVLGITNLFGDYKDKKGHITVYGKRALKWIIVSSIISAITFGLDRYIKHGEELADNKKTLESVNRSEIIITSINRSLNPIKDVQLSYELQLDFSKVKELGDYKTRLKAGLSRLMPLFAAKKMEINKDGVTLASVNNAGYKPSYRFRIHQNSSLFPDKVKESFAYVAVMQQIATFYFYRNPIRIDQTANFPAFNFNSDKDDKKADLVMEFDAFNNPNLRLEYDQQGDQLIVMADGLNTDPKTWFSSGNLISTEDFSKAQFFLSFSQLNISRKKEDASRIVVPEMTNFTLSLADGKRLAFDRSLKKHPFDKEVVYEYRFPANIDSLFRKNLFF